MRHATFTSITFEKISHEKNVLCIAGDNIKAGEWEKDTQEELIFLFIQMITLTT